MSMNTIEAIRAVLNATSSYGGANSARDALHELVAAYDALVPDWSQAPDWAKWATMFADGKVIFWELEPKCIFLSYEWGWKEKDRKIGLTISRMSSKVPIGIDWRLCKWQRPEVTP